MAEQTDKAVGETLAALFERIAKRSESIDTWLNYVGITFAVLLMTMTVVNVVGRYVFNEPVMAYVDVMQMMMALLVFLTLGYSQLKDGQIRFELFMTRILKGGRRYHVMESVHLFLALATFAVIAVNSADSAISAYQTQDTTLTVLLPTWPARAGVAIGAIGLCLRLFFQLVRNIGWAVSGSGKAAPSIEVEIRLAE